ncbi:MAG: hypothetical protein Kow00107_02310 [Planctomycetota bacterium]
MKLAKRGGEPELLRDILRRVIPRARSVNKLEKVRRKWREVVGADLALRTKVLSYRFGDLLVGVDSSSLMAELEFEKPGLAAALSEGDDPCVVRLITFRLLEETDD